ncbi:hypothetical protein BH24ACI5_BH24ACI5_09260 [soil metagenome]
MLLVFADFRWSDRRPKAGAAGAVAVRDYMHLRWRLRCLRFFV